MKQAESAAEAKLSKAPRLVFHQALLAEKKVRLMKNGIWLPFQIAANSLGTLLRPKPLVTAA